MRIFIKNDREIDLSPFLSYLILMVFLGVAFYIRFVNLSSYGIVDNDTVHYSDLIKAWSEGNFDIRYTKIGYYLLGGIAVKILGYYDFVLPYVSSLLDLGIILLIYFSGLKLGLNRWLSLSSVCLYAFLPSIIFQCLVALPHITSGFFLILSFYCLLCYFKALKVSGKVLFVSLAGMSLMYAITVHPTLLLCVPIFGILVMVPHFRPGKSGLRQISIEIKLYDIILYGCCFAFSAFFTLAAFAVLIHFGYSGSIQGADSLFSVFISLNKMWLVHRNSQLCGTPFHGFPEFLQFTFKEFKEYFLTVPVLNLLWAAIGGGLLLRFVSFFTLFRKTREQWILSVTFPNWNMDSFKNLLITGSILASFTLLYFVSAKFLSIRHFCPLVPYLILFVVIAFFRLTEGVQIFGRISVKLIARPVFFFLCLYVSWINIQSNPNVITKSPAYYRQMANVLVGKVDQNNRLLIAPYFTLRNVYFETKYIPKDYIYRLKTLYKPEANLLLQYRIRYIAILHFWWDRTLADNTTEACASTPGLKVTDERAKEVTEALYAGIKEVNAKSIYQNDAMKIYEIPLETLQSTPDTKSTADPFYPIAPDVVQWRRVVNIKR